MFRTLSLSRPVRFVVVLGLVTVPLTAPAGEPIDYNRDIRPIYAAKCFACHGPDEADRKADLRLDVRADAIEAGVILPGEPDLSEIVRRIESDDADERMPPPHADATLTDAETERFRRWIEQGAEYQEHWAFVSPQKPEVPQVNQTDWPRGPIDHFTLRRMERAGVNPAPPADRYALARRVSLDLIGLPPTPEEADAFVNDTSDDAYERYVDRLLKSERYGERWARLWLDLARYADTNGYEKDRPRSVWPYRDWVIRSLNDDMPFDQFTIEQLAGDMLPEPTDDQLTATGFHRNTMLNEEGGIDPLEYRFYAMVDRVATTGTVWLGLTTGCAQCHTHKYDPITHTDYYRLMGLLNNADEPDLTLRPAEIMNRRGEIQRKIEDLELALPEKFPAADGKEPTAENRERHLSARFDEWLTEQKRSAVRWSAPEATRLETNLPKLEQLPDGSIFASGDMTKRDVYDITLAISPNHLPVTALRLEVLPDERLPASGPGRAFYEGRKGDFFLSELTAKANGQAIPLTDPSHSFGKISIGSGSANAGNVIDGNGSTGWATATGEGKPHQLVLNLSEPITEPGELSIEMIFERHFAASLGRFRLSVASTERSVRATTLPVELEQILARNGKPISAEELSQLLREFLRTAPEFADARKEIDRLRKTLPKLPETLIFRERPADNPRPTFRHHRGEFLSPKEPVTPGLPELFMGTTSDPVTDRLEFARWLVSEGNPLTARVTVNRAWRAFFGYGLMRTSGDFGTQSEPPTHPELLDWLAVTFVDEGWSLKKLHRRIVLSSTYRQSTSAPPEMWTRDPENRLLARGPRHRLDAELVRDSMLRASGVLSDRMYGPSVYPPQPASVTALAYGGFRWRPSTGENRYRRSLYTFSKRTAPFAAFTVFDGPTGETCLARRDRSDTPLQILTLLNDPMFVELAQKLAVDVATPEKPSRQIATEIFRRLVTRPPTADELEAIETFQADQLARLKTGKLDAAKIASGDKPSDELAAWVLTARALMTLDEFLTKP